MTLQVSNILYWIILRIPRVIIELIFNEKIIIKINKKKFENLLSEISCLSEENQKIKKIEVAASFAVDNVCGYLSSHILEYELIKISQKYSIELNSQSEEDSYLHVMTQCYNTGGHTRIVERWIFNSPQNQKHSVILISQEKTFDIPNILLKNVAEKHGDVIQIDGNFNCLQKALNLRLVASKYKYIVLHTHMQDIIPIIAFGTYEFERPIIFFDHADHLFWLGVSISDLVVNLRSFAKKMCVDLRKTQNNYILPIPISDDVAIDSDFSKQIKAELNIENNSKIILTMADAYKFLPFGEYNFIFTIKKILKLVPNSYLLAIGPGYSDKAWQKASKITNGRIKPLGFIKNGDVSKYLRIANLYLDSFPFSSFTSLLDVAKYNVPVLSIKTPINELDTFMEADIYCKNQEELIVKSYELLVHSINLTSQTKIRDLIFDKHFDKGFQDKLIDLYNSLPIRHCLHFFMEDQDRKVSSSEIFLSKMQLTLRKQKRSSLMSFFFPNIKWLQKSY